MAKRGTGPTFIQRSREKAPSEKATYHQLTGAGRSHVKRKFLGLTSDEEKDIQQRLIDGINMQSRRSR